MKQGQSSKRARGRNGGRRGGNRQHTFDSNGPSVRIRGNAFQVYEKYLGLARDAASSGDRIAAENYYQHAEHYFRIYSAEQEERNQRHAANGQAMDGQRRANGRGSRGNGRGPAHGANGANGADKSPADEAQVQADAPASAEAESTQPEQPQEAAAEEPRPAPKRQPRRRSASSKSRSAPAAETPVVEDTVPPSASERDSKPVAGD